MDKSRLAKSDVVFDENKHEYWLGDKQLSGITSLLHRTLFADTYKGVSKAVLERAAERGSNIHYEVSMWINGGFDPVSIEGKNFVEKIAPSLDIVKSEYLVSDGSDYASSIDIVAAIDDDTVHLIDIKSNKSGIQRDYVAWQLSCYAYLIELMNPWIKVGRLSALWLSDNKAELIDVDRVEAVTVKSLMDADKDGLPFNLPRPSAMPESEAMARYREFEEEYVKLDARLKELDKLKSDALAEVKAAMENNNVNSLETDALKFTLVAETEAKTFDSKRFKDEQPGLYAGYLKTTKRSSYVKVTLKK